MQGEGEEARTAVTGGGMESTIATAAVSQVDVTSEDESDRGKDKGLTSLFARSVRPSAGPPPPHCTRRSPQEDSAA